MSGRAVSEVQSGKPNASTVEVLIQIWQRVLQRPSINPDDSFYDLGGTDGLADKVFAEIDHAFNRQVPTAAICYAPTIAKLATLLDGPALPRFSPFVPLKPGGEQPPIVIIHGLGGRASFFELAQKMGVENPIYGLQAKGIDGMEEPLNRIEQMAEYYLDSLRELQPQGPYILIGYSFGGLIALEMAQRLSKKGAQVALLVLVDTYPHPRYLSPLNRLRLRIKRIKGHLSDLRGKPLRVAASKVLGMVKLRGNTFSTISQGNSSTDISRLSFAQTTLTVKQSDFAAMKLYRPQLYRGKIKFVRPEIDSFLPADPNAVWKKLVQELEVETVPGDHLGMVSTRFETLAAVLTRYVREAMAK
jgi:aspartate racemase